jgi:hypothetical protein
MEVKSTITKLKNSIEGLNIRYQLTGIIRTALTINQE